MKPDELWEKYVGNGVMITRDDFLSALKEYGEAFRAEAVKVCRDEVDKLKPYTRTWHALHNRAAAISKMKLP